STTTRIYTLSLHDALPIYHALTYNGCHSKIEDKIRLMTAHGCGVRDIAIIASVSIGKVLNTIGSSVYKITPKKRYYERLEVDDRSEEHTSELQSRENLVCR